MDSKPTKRQVPIVCPGHTRPLTEVHYSPVTSSGFFLISGCHDKQPMLRRGDSGDWIGTFAGHKGAVWSAKLDGEALLAATGAADFTAKLWDALTGEELNEFPHKHIVKSVDFNSERTSLATAGVEGTLRVFDLEAGTMIHSLQHEKNEKVTINKTVWAPTPNTVFTGGSDGSVRLWDLRNGECTTELKVKGLVMDMDMTTTPRGPVMTVASGKTVSIFDARRLDLTASHEMQDINFNNEGGASLHPSGTKFIAGGSDLWVHVFDVETGKELECHKGHHGPVRCLRYAPDGSTYASGSEDGTIRIWETEHADSSALSGPSSI